MANIRELDKILSQNEVTNEDLIYLAKNGIDDETANASIDIDTLRTAVSQASGTWQVSPEPIVTQSPLYLDEVQSEVTSYTFDEISGFYQVPQNTEVTSLGLPLTTIFSKSVESDQVGYKLFSFKPPTTDPVISYVGLIASQYANREQILTELAGGVPQNSMFIYLTQELINQTLTLTNKSAGWDQAVQDFVQDGGQNAAWYFNDVTNSESYEYYSFVGESGGQLTFEIYNRSAPFGVGTTISLYDPNTGLTHTQEILSESKEYYVDTIFTDAESINESAGVHPRGQEFFIGVDYDNNRMSLIVDGTLVDERVIPVSLTQYIPFVLSQITEGEFEIQFHPLQILPGTPISTPQYQTPSRYTITETIIPDVITYQTIRETLPQTGVTQNFTDGSVELSGIMEDITYLIPNQGGSFGTIIQSFEGYDSDGVRWASFEYSSDPTIVQQQIIISERTTTQEFLSDVSSSIGTPYEGYPTTGNHVFVGAFGASVQSVVIQNTDPQISPVQGAIQDGDTIQVGYRKSDGAIFVSINGAAQTQAQGLQISEPVLYVQRQYILEQSQPVSYTFNTNYTTGGVSGWTSIEEPTVPADQEYGKTYLIQGEQTFNNKLLRQNDMVLFLDTEQFIHFPKDQQEIDQEQLQSDISQSIKQTQPKFYFGSENTQNSQEYQPANTGSMLTLLGQEGQLANYYNTMGMYPELYVGNHLQYVSDGITHERELLASRVIGINKQPTIASDVGNIDHNSIQEAGVSQLFYSNQTTFLKITALQTEIDVYSYPETFQPVETVYFENIGLENVYFELLKYDARATARPKYLTFKNCLIDARYVPVFIKTQMDTRIRFENCHFISKPAVIEVAPHNGQSYSQDRVIVDCVGCSGPIPRVVYTQPYNSKSSVVVRDHNMKTIATYDDALQKSIIDLRNIGYVDYTIRGSEQTYIKEYESFKNGLLQYDLYASATSSVYNAHIIKFLDGVVKDIYIGPNIQELYIGGSTIYTGEIIENGGSQASVSLDIPDQGETQITLKAVSNSITIPDRQLTILDLRDCDPNSVISINPPTDFENGSWADVRIAQWPQGASEYPNGVVLVGEDSGTQRKLTSRDQVAKWAYYDVLVGPTYSDWIVLEDKYTNEGNIVYQTTSNITIQNNTTYIIDENSPSNVSFSIQPWQFPAGSRSKIKNLVGKNSSISYNGTYKDISQFGEYEIHVSLDTQGLMVSSTAADKEVLVQQGSSEKLMSNVELSAQVLNRATNSNPFDGVLPKTNDIATQFSPDGKKIFVYQDKEIFVYEVKDFQVKEPGQDPIVVKLISNHPLPEEMPQTALSITIDSSGMNIYVNDSTAIHQIQLQKSYDFDSATYIGSFQRTQVQILVLGDGSKLFVVASNNNLQEINLSVPNDITSAVLGSNANLPADQVSSQVPQGFMQLNQANTGFRVFYYTTSSGGGNTRIDVEFNTPFSIQGGITTTITTKTSTLDRYYFFIDEVQDEVYAYSYYLLNNIPRIGYTKYDRVLNARIASQTVVCSKIASTNIVREYDPEIVGVSTNHVDDLILVYNRPISQAGFKGFDDYGTLTQIISTGKTINDFTIKKLQDNTYDIFAVTGNNGSSAFVTKLSFEQGVKFGAGVSVNNQGSVTTRDLTFQDGKWATIQGSQGSNIWISDDPRTVPFEAVWLSADIYDVVYQDSKWISVGRDGSIFAFDPINKSKTKITSPTTSWLRQVHFQQSKFVAVGDGGTIITSQDGLTWTAQTSGAANNLNGVYFDGVGTWVAVGSGGQILTSSDAITWTQATSGTTSILNDVFFQDSKWVVVGASGVTVSSSDAVTWTVGSVGSTIQLNGIHFQNQLWVAVGLSGRIYHSTDAVTWTQQILSVDLWSVIFQNGIWLVTTTGSNQDLYTSIDGINWVQQNENFQNDQMRTAFYGGGIWIMAGDNGYIVSSQDAETWNYSFVSHLNGRRIEYHNGTWIGLTSSGLLISTDSITWTEILPGWSATGVEFQDDTWYFTTTQDIYTSADLSTFNLVFNQSGSALDLEQISESNGTIIQVGETGTIRRSIDSGANWTTPTSVTALRMFDVFQQGGIWLAYGEQQTILISEDDGLTWEQLQIDASSTLTIADLKFVDGVWYAILQGSIYMSRNARDWTLNELLSAPQSILTQLEYNGGFWTVLGNSTFNPTKQYTIGSLEGSIYTIEQQQEVQIPFNLDRLDVQPDGTRIALGISTVSSARIKQSQMAIPYDITGISLQDLGTDTYNQVYRVKFDFRESGEQTLGVLQQTSYRIYNAVDYIPDASDILESRTSYSLQIQFGLNLKDTYSNYQIFQRKQANSPYFLNFIKMNMLQSVAQILKLDGVHKEILSGVYLLNNFQNTSYSTTKVTRSGNDVFIYDTVNKFIIDTMDFEVDVNASTINRMRQSSTRYVDNVDDFVYQMGGETIYISAISTIVFLPTYDIKKGDIITIVKTDLNNIEPIYVNQGAVSQFPEVTINGQSTYTFPQGVQKVEFLFDGTNYIAI